MPDPIVTNLPTSVIETAGCVQRHCRHAMIVTSRWTDKHLTLQHESDVVARTAEGDKTLGVEEVIEVEKVSPSYIISVLDRQHRQFEQTQMAPIPGVKAPVDPKLDPATEHGRKYS
jgi:hypothetical protein